MAAITVVATEVVAGSEGAIDRGIGGEVLTRGLLVYRKAADGRYWQADADALESAAATHIVLTGCPVAGAEVLVQELEGDITLGATAALVVGRPYFVSPTAGKLGELADLTLGKFPTFVGFGLTAAILRCGRKASAVAVPA